MTMKLVIIWAVTTALFYTAAASMRRKAYMKQRVELLLAASATPEEIQKEQQIQKRKSVMAGLSKVFYGMSFRRTEVLLEQAGSTLLPEEFFAWRIVVAGSALLCFLLAGFSWYLNAAAAAAAFFVPVLYMKRRRHKRLQALSGQLIEALGTMANSMRAGFSFMQAMQLSGKEMPKPIGPEFARAVQEIGLGIPVEEALQSLVSRLPNRDLDVVVQAILAQRSSGGNLAELLETIEETIRGRVRVAEEMRTLTAQGRMSALVVTLLPVGLALYLATASPEYFGPMLHHPIGRIMLGAAGVSIAIGWFVIRKMIRIEV
ncbi:type II secretion system F family protein [Ectobacillus ponti]|uniref:Type II secretion system F family protein n=1 Tax=Ectobacillus ponti TaxID=2961894 RepID=A0AA42BPZ7_9BACI|nr:type II secretion system F family protein [Ectobacillus ponti]MCP8969327.1 type II secretion system F family protein [Ectobacillus ponti]